MATPNDLHGFIQGDSRLLMAIDPGVPNSEPIWFKDYRVGGVQVLYNISLEPFDVEAINSFNPHLDMPLRWEMTFDIDHDPIFERAPHDIAGVWRWIKRCWRYSMREANGRNFKQSDFDVIFNDGWIISKN